MMTVKKCLMVVGVALAMASCSKEGDIPAMESTDSSMEILAKEPAPGDYTIGQFIENGVDQTQKFDGWTFTFQSTGFLIATSPTFQSYTGTWDMNYSETTIDLNVVGTFALTHLSTPAWEVDRITNKGMQFSTIDDTLIFKADGGY